jgi:hypothetical protein
LLLYVAASHAAVSVALVQEKQDGQAKKQVLVYFISEVLSPSKKNYTELEKVLYAVLMAYRKATGRVGKWAAELKEFTIDYVHRSSIQS